MVHTLIYVFFYTVVKSYGIEMPLLISCLWRDISVEQLFRMSISTKLSSQLW